MRSVGSPHCTQGLRVTVRPRALRGVRGSLLLTRTRPTNHRPIQANTSAIFTAEEVDTWSAIASRTGSTLSAEVRKLYSGEQLGFGNAGKDTRVIVKPHSYRAIVVVGVQPERSGTNHHRRGWWADTTVLVAVAENRLAINPVDGVELPSVTSVEQRFLTLEQLHTLAEAAGPHRPLVYVLGTCGLRFGEVAELRWRDVDLQKLQIRIVRSVTLVDGVFEVGTPKSVKGRTVSLPAFVADLLKPGQPDALVFPDSEGGHMRGTNVRRRWWSKAVAAAELYPRTVGDSVVYDFKLHELRHTAASLAIQAGANIKALQNMLGHESAGLTLDRYGHLYGSDVEAVGTAINALLTRQCGQNVVTDEGCADLRKPEGVA